MKKLDKVKKLIYDIEQYIMVRDSLNEHYHLLFDNDKEGVAMCKLELRTADSSQNVFKVQLCPEQVKLIMEVLYAHYCTKIEKCIQEINLYLTDI